MANAGEVTAAAGLKNLKARDGVLADLDFTGKLDLLTIQPGGQRFAGLSKPGEFLFPGEHDEFGAAGRFGWGGAPHR